MCVLFSAEDVWSSASNVAFTDLDLDAAELGGEVAWQLEGTGAHGQSTDSVTPAEGTPGGDIISISRDFCSLCSRLKQIDHLVDIISMLGCMARSFFSNQSPTQ